MRIAIGSEQRGNRAKGQLLTYLRSLTHEVEDLGCRDPVAAGGAEIAPAVAAAVARGEFDVGILISGSGTGMCMAANKVPGARAAAVHDEFVARRTRQRHCCNVLCLGADLDGIDHLTKIVDHFLAAETSPAQHAPTLEKLSKIERTVSPGAVQARPAGAAVDGWLSQGPSGSKEVAEAVSRARDRLLAMLSHELRAPLGPALIAARLLEEDEAVPEHLREDVELIRRCIESEVRLIDSILEAARVAHGKLRLSLEDVDAHGLLLESVAVCQADALGRLIEVRVDARAARHIVRGDSVKLQQVFCNLLKNAIKFSDPRGRVTVRTAENGSDSLRIEVCDTGVGIPADLLPRIFDPFEQGDAAANDRFGSIGLGLAICKGIVQAHGGVIWASSEGRGKGASLSVLLPLAAHRQLPDGPHLNAMPSSDGDAGLRVSFPA